MAFFFRQFLLLPEHSGTKTSTRFLGNEPTEAFSPSNGFSDSLSSWMVNRLSSDIAASSEPVSPKSPPNWKFKSSASWLPAMSYSTPSSQKTSMSKSVLPPSNKSPPARMVTLGNCSELAAIPVTVTSSPASNTTSLALILEPSLNTISSVTSMTTSPAAVS